MKTKLLLPFLLVAFAHAQQASVPDPEMAKIDARLKELTEIWRQDTGVINKLTNFKRTPVQEGTKAYYQCLEASKRIQAAEAEAKTLKEKKAALQESGGTKASGTATGGAAEKNKFFEVVDQKVPSVAYDRKQHGPKVKDLFIGMSMSDFAEKIGSLEEKPYRIIRSFNGLSFLALMELNRLADPKMVPNGQPIFHAIVPNDVDSDRMVNGGPMGLASKDGHVTGIIISGFASKSWFKSESTTLEEFVKNFEDGYNVQLSINLRKTPPTYEGITEEGVMITILSDFGITMSKAAKPEDTKKAFD